MAQKSYVSKAKDSDIKAIEKKLAKLSPKERAHAMAGFETMVSKKARVTKKK